jgi:hypothetical protein
MEKLIAVAKDALGRCSEGAATGKGW